MSSSVDLVKSVLSDDATKVLIKNTCAILDCERCSLFIYDKLSDKLIVHSADGLKSGEIRVPVDKGIAGAVFLSGEKLKIDDAYQDPRFNKEVDRSTGYKTKTLLCFPLKDDDGCVFGVIQAINKRQNHFTGDDEELLYIFSKQASCILLSLINKETSTLMISKLKKIINFSVKISAVKSRAEFTKETEDLLMSLFSSSSVQFLFVNDRGYLYSCVKNEEFSRTNIGIIYYVFNTKQLHGCIKVKDSKYYNPLVDIPCSENLVTFPIVINDRVVAVLQTIVLAELYENTGHPKENEMIIFNLLRDCIVSWYKRNDIKIII